MERYYTECLLDIASYSEWYSGWCIAKLHVLSRDKEVKYEMNFVYALYCLTYGAYNFECSSFSQITEITILSCRSHELWTDRTNSRVLGTLKIDHLIRYLFQVPSYSFDFLTLRRAITQITSKGCRYMMKNFTSRKFTSRNFPASVFLLRHLNN